MNYIRAIDEIFGQFKGSKFAIRFWTGEEHFYGSGQSPRFVLNINDAATCKRLLSQGSIGFGEAYMDGRITIEGDMDAYLGLRHDFKARKFSLHFLLAVLWARWHEPRKREDQIAHHYDTGNSFFKLFLDKETRSYSCGKYYDGTESLGTAQKNKLEFVCKWMNLPAGSRVLDLGSGWGGFAQYAAEHFKWHIKGYTLSKAQLEYCLEMVDRNHLDRLVTFEYFDMLADFPDEQFDGIAMIESIEHVGQKNIAPFFRKIKKVLKPGSSFIIQSTVRETMRSVDRWTLKYVFPGGYLPSKKELTDAALRAGLVIEESVMDTTDYIRIVKEWIRNLEANKEKIQSDYGERSYRLWDLWLHGTKVAFEKGAIGLLRLHLKVPQ